MPKEYKQEKLEQLKLELVGKVFGEWTLVNIVGSDLNGKRVAECQCSCGNFGYITLGSLKQGTSTRCYKCRGGRGSDRPKSLTDEQLRELLSRYASGESTTQLAKAFNVCSGTVIYQARKAGIYRTIQDQGRKSRKPAGEAAFSVVYKRYKGTAKYRQREFKLSKIEFREITQRKCYYCRAEPNNKQTLASGSFVYNGVDRVDSSLGYILANVVSCCKECNTAKSDRDVVEYYEWLVRSFNTLRSNMPTYTYEHLEKNDCKLGFSFELFQQMKDEPLTACEECKAPLKRLFGPGSAVIFKGTGWGGK